MILAALLGHFIVAAPLTPDDARQRADAGAQATVREVQWADGRGAWRVAQPLDPVRLEAPVVYVDGTSGRILDRFDAVVDGRVRVFDPNPVLAPTAAELELPLLEAGATSLSGAHVRTFNCLDAEPGGLCTPTAVAAADANGDFFVPVPDLRSDDAHTAPEDTFAETSAHYHVERAIAWAHARGLPGLLCNLGGEPVTVVVNYRVMSEQGYYGIDNAAYTGSCGLTMAIGQGTTADWSYDGDFVTHEVAHGFMEERRGGADRLHGRVMRPRAVGVDPGALGEGIADFLAFEITGDPTLGEYVNGRRNRTPRTADNDLVWPDDLTGQIHADGELVSGALWEVAADLPPDQRDAFDVAVLDTVGQLDAGADFRAFSLALFEVLAADVSAQLANRAHEVLLARGMEDGHHAVQTLSPDLPRRRPLWLVAKGLEDEGYAPMRPPPLQLRLEVPEGATEVVLRYDEDVQLTPGWEPLTTVEAVTRWDSAITFTYAENPDGGVTVDADSDGLFASETDGELPIPVTRSGPLFVALFNRGVHTTALHDLTVSYVIDEDAGTTGGELPETGEATGCGCRSFDEPGALPLLFVLASGWRRRP